MQTPEEEDSEGVQGRQCLLCFFSSWGPVRQPTGSALRDHSVACNVLLHWMQRARTNAQMKICKSSLSFELHWPFLSEETAPESPAHVSVCTRLALGYQTVSDFRSLGQGVKCSAASMLNTPQSLHL